MNDETIWLYSVIDHENLSVDELQNLLNKWSNEPTPNELISCGDKMIIKYQSNLTRSAYFNEAAKQAITSRRTMNLGSI